MDLKNGFQWVDKVTKSLYSAGINPWKRGQIKAKELIFAAR